MRIFVIETFGGQQLERNRDGMMRALMRHGEVEYCNYRHLDQRFGLKAMNRMLYERILRFRPHLIFMGQSERVNADVLAEAKRQTCAFVAYYYGDYRDPPEAFVGKLGAVADVTFLVSDEESVKQAYMAAGVRNVGDWWVWGVNTQVFKPDGSAPIHDVVFTGHNWVKLPMANRRHLIPSIGQAQIALHVYGEEWGDLGTKYPAITVHDSVSGAKLVRAIRKGKLTIGSNYTTRLSLNASWGRVFHSMACGRMHLHHYVEGTERLFEKGVHLDWFTTSREAVAMVRYYLTHHEERERIARAGAEYVRREYSWERQAEKLLEICRGEGMDG